MKRLIFCGVALGAIATASIAAAADMPLKAPPPPLPSWSWAGFYGGKSQMMPSPGLTFRSSRCGV